MEYQERAKELIKKFDNIYQGTDWTNIAIKSIDELIQVNDDVNYIEYWENVKNVIINRNK